MIRKNIAHPFQGAFTRGRRGTDHIFLANTLINQAKFLGHPLYAAFIDLQKAYDSVCRPLLFRKMVMAGLGPKFCTIVEDMYINASYRIKVGNKLGSSFSTMWDSARATPSPLYSISLSQTLLLPSPQVVLPLWSRNFRSQQSNLRTIFAILLPLPRASVSPSNVPLTTVKPTGSE